MEIFRLWELSFKLGNSNFDYNIYNANGNSGGILCIWDPNTFLKDHHIISDNFVVIADHHLSDHRPILLREVFVDYGATPFRFYHSWINISVMVDGDWIDDPNHVKSEFCSHFASKFQRPGDSRSRINFPFPNQLNSEQATSLETPISIDEIKSAVWACGSLYKVVTKILAIRLGSVIDNLISEVQSAFLPKRQILDGPFVINEVLSWCKHKRRQAMIFKVDFAKAYDSVRWDFLDDVLLSFGFGQKWRDWILGSLSSGKAYVLVNGSPTSEFQFHCGLKQDSLGCFSGHETSFQLSNLVSPEGGNMAIIKAWDVIIGGKTEVSSFLSVRSILLSNGVGFTLLKSAYGASPILFYFGLNRALLFKWVWRFISQDGSLWARVISAIHGSNIQEHRLCPSSVWNSISREVRVLKNLGVDLISYCLFPRIFALDNNKLCSVSAKFSEGLSNSLRRPVRGGVESHQLSLLNEMVSSISLSNSEDRWVWNLNGSGLFRVCDIRNLLDEKFLPKVEVATRWVKYIPIKLNIFAWRVCLDRLPTRLNLVRRDVQVSSLDCPICSLSH
ncbi:RNA-directed DNA polymerase, eukaryota [Tanacetum coccineum]